MSNVLNVLKQVIVTRIALLSFAKCVEIGVRTTLNNAHNEKNVQNVVHMIMICHIVGKNYFVKNAMILVITKLKTVYKKFKPVQNVSHKVIIINNVGNHFVKLVKLGVYTTKEIAHINVDVACSVTCRKTAK